MRLYFYGLVFFVVCIRTKTTDRHSINSHQRRVYCRHLLLLTTSKVWSSVPDYFYTYSIGVEVGIPPSILPPGRSLGFKTLQKPSTITIFNLIEICRGAISREMCGQPAWLVTLHFALFCHASHDFVNGSGILSSSGSPALKIKEAQGVEAPIVIY